LTQFFDTTKFEFAAICAESELSNTQQIKKNLEVQRGTQIKIEEKASKKAKVKL
jgi:hypothetical protein